MSFTQLIFCNFFGFLLFIFVTKKIKSRIQGENLNKVDRVGWVVFLYLQIVAILYALLVGERKVPLIVFYSKQVLEDPTLRIYFWSMLILKGLLSVWFLFFNGVRDTALILDEYFERQNSIQWIIVVFFLMVFLDIFLVGYSFFFK